MTGGETVPGFANRPGFTTGTSVDLMGRSGVGVMIAGFTGCPGFMIETFGAPGLSPRFPFPVVGTTFSPGDAGVTTIGFAGAPGFATGMVVTVGFSPRLPLPVGVMAGCPGKDGVAAVGFTCMPGRSGFTDPGTIGWPGVMAAVPPGLEPRKGLRPFLLIGGVLAMAVGIVPGSLAGAVFDRAPGVSLAIFACNAAARFGSAIPFQPLSNFGLAIVAAMGGSEVGFLVRVTVGALIESTPADRLENLPSGVTGLLPAWRFTLTVGMAELPERTIALFTALKLGPPLKRPFRVRAILVTLLVVAMIAAFC